MTKDYPVEQTRYDLLCRLTGLFFLHHKYVIKAAPFSQSNKTFLF
jgi:hypothetical protein